jgi:filamentous hemagglutinin family protein
MFEFARTRPAASRGRPRLLARTALCGALFGLASLLPGAALAVPEGGFADVNAGGAAPTISLGPNSSVKLSAPRTIISWTTFNVAPEESVDFNFGARNWIVLNKIIGLRPSKIEGTITGKVGGDFGGNVWFTSQNSIIFGKTAHFDAGGLLVAIGTPDTAGFLDPANSLFSFSGGDTLPGTKLYVLSGAGINGHGGLVAFAGPSIVTRANAIVTSDGGGSVLYGSAKTFQIRLAPGSGGDFDLVDFIVPDISGGGEEKVALDLAGDTKGNSVFIAAVSKSAIGSAVVNLVGLVTAQTAASDGGDIILSGGGSILNRLPGPTLTDAANTDIYLNKATASRDLQIRNVGQTIARPWVRPAEDSIDPPTLAEDATVCDFRTESCSLNPNGGCTSVCAPIEGDPGLLSSLFDPTAISTINVGRDARIAATANIELGRIVANRDISVAGPQITGNSLIAAGALNVVANVGDVALAGVGVNRDGVVTSTFGDVKIDAISAPQRLTVNAGRDITLGDGTSAVAGLITLKAAQNVTLELASAKIDTVTAGATANLRGGALDIGTVTATRLLAKADSVRIGAAVSSSDVYVVGVNGDAIVGSATAGDDVFVLATHGTASLGAATLTGAAPDAVGFDFDGNPDVSGNGRVVRVESLDLDARLGLGTGSVTGSTIVSVSGGQDAVVDVIKDLPGTFSVIAARDATLRAPTANLNTLTAGRDLTFATTSGDLTLTTPLAATRNISISAGGALKVADVRADAGSILLSGSSVAAGNVSASEDLTLKATVGGVSTTSFKAGRDLIVQGTTLALGSSIGPVTRDLSITSLGNFTSTTPLSAGRNLTIDAAGTAVLAQTTASGTLRIVAGDLDLTGLATAANAQIESRSGALRVGGSAGGGGLVFDSNDFSQMRVAGALKFYAGSTTGTARGDLTIQNLTVTVANTPNVTFLAGNSANALVQGLVAPTASGGILRIGDATDAAWRPGSILITGGLGAATLSGNTYSDIRAFDEVRLAAKTDILLGSSRFIGLIQGAAVGDIDIAAGKPAGVAPTGDEASRVFISTGKLEVSAANKVVQQNTAPLGAGQAGVFFTGKSNPALIIDPPRLLELWGALAGPDGKVLSGTAAGGAITFVVVDASGAPTAKPADASYRFNSCDVGTSTCSAAIVGGGSGGGTVGSGASGAATETVVAQTNAGILAARDGLSPAAVLGSSSVSSSTSETSQEAAAAQLSSSTLTSPPALLAVAPVSTDEIVLDPVVTGTGSEEIWRKRRQQK